MAAALGITTAPGRWRSAAQLVIVAASAHAARRSRPRLRHERVSRSRRSEARVLEGGDVWIEARGGRDDRRPARRRRSGVRLSERPTCVWRATLFAGSCRRHGELAADVATGSTTRRLVQRRRRHPDWAYAGSLSAARNLEYTRLSAAVAEADEIAFMPPVSGG